MTTNALTLLGSFRDEMSKPLDGVREKIRGVGKAAEGAEKKTRGWSTGLMSMGFFLLFSVGRVGTAMRFLAEDSVRLFSKMNGGMTEAGRTAAMLSSVIELIKFKIGEAISRSLIPFRESISGVVDQITTWIENNPTWVAGIIASVAALGFLAVVVGSIILLAAGVGTVWAIVIVAIIGAISGLVGWFVKLKTEGYSTWDAIKIIAIKSVAFLVKFAVQRFLDLVFAFFKVAKWVGEIWNKLINFLIEKLMPFFNAFATVFNSVANFLVGIANWIIGVWENIINKIINLINKLLANSLIQKGLSLAGLDDRFIGEVSIPRIAETAVTGEGIAESVREKLTVNIDLTNAIIDNEDWIREKINEAMDGVANSILERSIEKGE